MKEVGVMKKGRLILWSVILLAVLGVGVYAGLQFAGRGDQTAIAPATPTDAGQQTGTSGSKTEPGTSQPPAQTSPPSDSKTPTTPPAQKPPELPQKSDVLTLNAYSGSGSLPIEDMGYANDAFRLERIDWQGGTLHIVGKMRAFEAVGYFRVRDENKQVVFAETVIRAREGAPAWSAFDEASFPLAPALKGKALSVEFYVKSMKDGSRINMLTMKIRLQ
jgi:hypothetical protein